MSLPFRARYGDVDLLVTRFESSAGRDWSIQSPTRGDDHAIQDRGKTLKSSSCEICFCDEPAQREDHVVRYYAFQSLANAGPPQLFTHPLDGSYPAIIQNMRTTGDADSPVITVTCDVLGMKEPVGVFQVGAGVTPAAGLEEVEVTVETANAQLEDLELESSVPATCLATVEGWANAADPDTRAVLLELGSLSQQIDESITALDLLVNYERWELYKSFVALRYQIGRAAETVIADTAAVLEHTVRVSAPLLVIAARLYGGRDAGDRAVTIAKLNGLKRPGLVVAGTVLKVPTS